PRALHSFPTRRSSDLFSLTEPRALDDLQRAGPQRVDIAARSGPTHSPLFHWFSTTHPQNEIYRERARELLARPNAMPSLTLFLQDRKSTRLNSSHVKI